ncbi:CDK5RAP1-like protein isoform X2 [Calliopsis andreniformis]|uniref:CDK5RAP1-like protein isoform X2 n=1 Tax=Calliopsis andreniformis TaxID=337506 RepID=UPI003FCDB32A
MNSIVCTLDSLKQIKSSKTCQNFLSKLFNERFDTRHKNVFHSFQQYRRLHFATTQLEIHKESSQKNTIDLKQFRDLSKNGPSLRDFISPEATVTSDPIKVPDIPYIKNIDGSNQKVFFEVYGCQMNVNDTEVIWSILKSHGYKKVLNGIRRKRSKKDPMKIGLLGCMAERLKDKILERGRLVDVIAGPDSYKDLPRLLSTPDSETAINVLLSFDETYADITPVRLNPDSTSAFVTIMRGCDNMCTYCIVPFTRGRERSRPIESIIREVQSLSDDGVKEVMLLGQNVNSYRDTSQSDFFTAASTETHLAKGFKTVYKSKKGGRRFCDLLDEVSRVNPEIRIRFTSPHPKDFPDEVLQLIAERPNICKEIHLPAQSGNSSVLERMRRGYTREAYLDLVHHIRDIVPNIYLSSDFIAGFCGETEEEFQDTLSLIELVKYNKAFLFSYSLREKTTAHRRLKDDVEVSVKKERLDRMITVYRTEVEKLNNLQIGQLQLVLVEGLSKRTDDYLQGRNDGNTRVIIPTMEAPVAKNSTATRAIKNGDYVVVKIHSANSNSLMGTPLYHSSIAEFASSSEF